MRPAWRHGAITIALVGCVGLAAAAQTGRGQRSGQSTDATLMDETTGSVGSPRAQRATGELALSDEQRGRIYEGVMRIPGAPVAHEPPPALSDPLPGGVPIQDLPTGVTREIPLVQGHKFVKFDDRILVVEPASRLVVAMIPRYKLLP
jgi:hypothetical protein